MIAVLSCIARVSRLPLERVAWCGTVTEHCAMSLGGLASGVADAPKTYQDGRTLAVDAITGGLIEQWNMEHPEKAPGRIAKPALSHLWAFRLEAPRASRDQSWQALRPKDRIVEVNGLRGDVLQLVDECKKPKAKSMLCLGSWQNHIQRYQLQGIARGF